MDGSRIDLEAEDFRVAVAVKVVAHPQPEGGSEVKLHSRPQPPSQHPNQKLLLELLHLPPPRKQSCPQWRRSPHLKHPHLKHLHQKPHPRLH